MQIIDRVTDGKGKVIQKSRPARAGDAAPRIIDARNAFLMTSMMQDVVRGGTAARAMKLGRTDLAGKTGTTNDQRDAWFAGFNPKLVAIAWVGYDNPKSLGSSETGAAAALPIWMTYMETALKGLPDEPAVAPEGVVAAQVNPHTGLRDDRGTDSVPEYFFQENLPPDDDAATQPSEKRRGKHDEVDDQLY